MSSQIGANQSGNKYYIKEVDNDSPAKQRFKLISEKWSNIAQNIDRDKEDRRNNLDENLSNLENRVANDRPIEEAKFRNLKDSVLKL